MNYDENKPVLSQMRDLDIGESLDIPRERMMAINSAMVTLASKNLKFSRILNKPNKQTYKVTRVQ